MPDHDAEKLADWLENQPSYLSIRNVRTLAAKELRRLKKENKDLADSILDIVPSGIDRLEQYKERITELKAVIQGALRIKSLWMPSDDQNDPNHDEEFAALAMMRQAFTEAITKAEGSS